MKGTKYNARLEAALERKPVLVMAHRGVSCANIVDNTVESFDAAIRQGADIVEADVCETLDGDLFVLHDGMEPVVLGQEESIVNMRTEDVRKLRYINHNHLRIDHPVNTLDEVLEHLKGRCIINIDRGWNSWDKIFRAVLRHDMADQILFKSPPEEKYLRQMAEQREPFLYMPVAWFPEEVELVETYDLNMVAVEVFGYREDAPIMSAAFLSRMKERGVARLVSALTLADPVMPSVTDRWRRAGGQGRRNMANAIMDRRILLAGGHDDDMSVLGNADQGWGWLVERGFNILQTDWTLDMNLYLKARGYIS